MLRFAIFSVLFVLALCLPVQAVGECSQARLEQAANRVRDVQTILLATRVGSMDPSIPPEIRPQIRAMKDALAAAVDLEMNCLQGAFVNAETLQDQLSALLGANKPQRPAYNSAEEVPAEVDNIFGADLKISVSKPAAGANLVGVQLSFGVACGHDTMLLLYTRQAEEWRQVLRWQSEDYRAASGAFGDLFQYLVFPGKIPDEWTAVVKHGTPSCTSCWSSFDIDVLDTAHGAAPQKLQLHRKEGYYRCEDDGAGLMRRVDGFEIRVRDMSIDPGVWARKVIYRYRIVGSDVERVQPVALNVRDFVDVWLWAKWNEAAAWSAPENLQSLEKEHSRLTKLRNFEPPAESVIMGFGAVQSCSNDSKGFQVTLDLDPGAPVYFAVREGAGSFTMLSASDRRDPTCEGPDIVQKP